MKSLRQSWIVWKKIKSRQTTTHYGWEKKCFISRLEKEIKNTSTLPITIVRTPAHVHSPVRTLFPSHEILDLACNRLPGQSQNLLMRTDTHTQRSGCLIFFK